MVVKDKLGTNSQCLYTHVVYLFELVHVNVSPGNNTDLNMYVCSQTLFKGMLEAYIMPTIIHYATQ